MRALHWRHSKCILLDRPNCNSERQIEMRINVSQAGVKQRQVIRPRRSCTVHASSTTLSSESKTASSWVCGSLIQFGVCTAPEQETITVMKSHALLPDHSSKQAAHFHTHTHIRTGPALHCAHGLSSQDGRRVEAPETTRQQRGGTSERARTKGGRCGTAPA